MISISEAIAIIKANIPSPATMECRLDQSIGKYLAEDVHAPEDSPRYTNSAMDGYAVRWLDVRDAAPDRPAILAIAGESQAGIPFSGRVEAGRAARISTGAMLPDGVDTVIRVEDTREEGDWLAVLTASRLGQDVRHRGEEFSAGALLLHGRTRISAPQAALLAAVGINRVKVFKPCEIVLLVTGSELVAAGEEIAEFQIRDSNMIMLRAAVQEAGATMVSCARIADDRQATAAAIGQAEADLVICTGGVSVGRHDHVREAAEANGFSPLFWKIRQKPGKPLYLARKGRTLLFGLPGNPVSAFMCFAHYVRPVIGVFSGLPFGWPTVSAQAAAELANNGGRTNMIRTRLTWRPNDGYCLVGAEKQGSHMLTSLADADGYVILEPGQAVRAGDRVDVYHYDFRREPV